MSVPNKFENYSAGKTDGISKAVEVTPDDDTDLPFVTTGLYLGTSGDIYVDFLGGGQNVPLKGVAAGMWHPLIITRVYATGTTAGDIVAGTA
ncbi:spike base protein, RCAP_Rcc01079 family [Pseudosulfitobacter pseudonitzschiae]|uniref:spike base protein, RCAP_Rcc01079 family n=1 Tax=Pseudosulfitobacter pseudonitzschiae TaxID=1402135 RepID=UPI001AF13E34|nr:hypothetical protein [Pseudosulfitobacter pseudonitzschiae]MBM1817149.1 hypothetical protein [Pseudosulfitobacter pseudonitzschiae]MBM1834152.1 hypothetical protein [Pseudosulfitobacter pseudonitzschiae]MBM1839017.1 hypothetical protein [Pseudosulfitobacter pseudonitzschiae]MBM1843867.1 hypothetical protein [Pseudosulfitobacter pseudonitzschiae]MBM1848713.1 hypothetical protein [Pseudosulfitobacter pseudonitzschiae]